jgi:hypothetical protein
MGTEIYFDAYLRSVVKAYQKWEKQYTLMDVTGRSQLENAIYTIKSSKKQEYVVYI